LQSY